MINGNVMNLYAEINDNLHILKYQELLLILILLKILLK